MEDPNCFCCDPGERCRGFCKSNAAYAKEDRLRPDLNMTQSASDLIIDRETAQILLDLLNPIHGGIDRQFLDKPEDPMPHPDDEHDVIITTKMERDLTQAVMILHSRLKDELIGR